MQFPCRCNLVIIPSESLWTLDRRCFKLCKLEWVVIFFASFWPKCFWCSCKELKNCFLTHSFLYLMTVTCSSVTYYNHIKQRTSENLHIKSLQCRSTSLCIFLPCTLFTFHVFYLFVPSGFEDQSDRTQKTDLGLVGRPATRRHPTETSTGHLPQGESCDPWPSSKPTWIQTPQAERSTSLSPDGSVFLWGNCSIPTAVVTTQLITQISQTGTKWPTHCSFLPAGLSWILITRNWLSLSQWDYALMSQ